VKNFPQLNLATPWKEFHGKSVKRISFLYTFSRVLELEANPGEGQQLQQKDKKKRKGKAKQTWVTFSSKIDGANNERTAMTFI